MTKVSVLRSRLGRLAPHLPVLALAFGFGALMSLALAPNHMLWTVPIALAVIGAFALRAQTSWSGAMLGWAFGLGYFAFGLSWIVEPFQVDAQRHAWMAPFALVFLAGGLALFWGAAFAGAVRWSRGQRGSPC